MKKYLSLLLVLFVVACKQKQPNTEFAPLFPFLISYDSPDNVVNMSHLLVAPAGKNGFIRAENGRFVDNSGPVRLNATNLTGPANFPTHEQADRLAARLARFGFNCVRLHYMDDAYGNFRNEKEPGIIAADSKTQRNLDPQQLEKLDYLIAALKKTGIYVNINLHVARFWDERDGFTGKDQRPWADKGLDNFEPRMIELQKEYAKKLLTHVNQYTGLAYTSDPCVAVIEINNENALFNQYHGGAIDKLPDPYASEFRKQWNKWLKNKYGSTQKMREAWALNDKSVPDKQAETTVGFAKEAGIEKGNVPVIKLKDNVPTQAFNDFYQFLVDTEQKYWTGMYKYIKNELKTKSLVSGTQLGYSPPQVQAQLDYVDSHSYWCHPSPVNPDWEIRNESMVNSMSCIQGLANQRVHGKPFTVSEYNHPFPNQYGAEGQPMLRAYGRLQGWDGVFEYTYNHRSNEEPENNIYFFSIAARTDVLAHIPACSAIYLRGDVQEAKSSVLASFDYPAYFTHLTSAGKVRADIELSGFDPRLSLVHRTAVGISGQVGTDPAAADKISDNQKVFISDTGELTWNIEQPEAGYFTVNTPNTKLFTGFPSGRLITMGDVSLSVGNTRLGWATVSLVSKNATGFGQPGSQADILLTATGLIENKDMVMQETSKTKIKLTDWGKSPVYAEGIPATITLPSDPSKTKCFALDTKGDRKSELQVEKSANGSKIIIGPENQTVWYEIVVQ